MAKNVLIFEPVVSMKYLILAISILIQPFNECVIVVKLCRQLSMGIPERPHPLKWVCTIVILSNEPKIAENMHL